MSMIVDWILILLTLGTALTGIFWKEKKTRQVTIALVTLAVGSAVGAMTEAFLDDRDKELSKDLALDNVTLPNSAFDLVEREVQRAYPKATCQHTDMGVTCHLEAGESNPAHTLVINRREAATIYVDAKGKKDTTPFLKGISETRYDPRESTNEFSDKLIILGFDTFYNICGRYPNDYNYNSKFRVKLLYNDKEIVLAPDEIAGVKADVSRILFAHFHKLFHTKIRGGTDCK